MKNMKNMYYERFPLHPYGLQLFHATYRKWKQGPCCEMYYIDAGSNLSSLTPSLPYFILPLTLPSFPTSPPSVLAYFSFKNSSAHRSAQMRHLATA